jgi:hypothetical protein
MHKLTNDKHITDSLGYLSSKRKREISVIMVEFDNSISPFPGLQKSHSKPTCSLVLKRCLCPTDPSSKGLLSYINPPLGERGLSDFLYNNVTRPALQTSIQNLLHTRWCQCKMDIPQLAPHATWDESLALMLEARARWPIRSIKEYLSQPKGSQSTLFRTLEICFCR